MNRTGSLHDGAAFLAANPKSRVLLETTQQVDFRLLDPAAVSFRKLDVILIETDHE